MKTIKKMKSMKRKKKNEQEGGGYLQEKLRGRKV